MAVSTTSHAAAAVVTVEATGIDPVRMIELPPGFCQFMRCRAAMAVMTGIGSIAIGPLVAMAGITDRLGGG